jgi:hypothetical protein
MKNYDRKFHLSNQIKQVTSHPSNKIIEYDFSTYKMNTCFYCPEIIEQENFTCRVCFETKIRTNAEYVQTLTQNDLNKSFKVLQPK